MVKLRLGNILDIMINMRAKTFKPSIFQWHLPHTGFFICFFLSIFLQCIRTAAKACQNLNRKSRGLTIAVNSLLLHYTL